MRICRVTSEFPPPWNGLAPGPFALSFAQFRSGVELTVIARDKAGAKELDVNLPFLVKRVPSRFDAEFSFRAYSKFQILNKSSIFDLVHGHGFSSMGILLAKKFGKCRIPVVTTIHCVRHTQRKSQNKALRINSRDIMSYRKVPARPYLLWEALQEKFVIKNSNRICAVSVGVKRDIIDIYSIQPEKIVVVGNGVDASQFRPSNQLPFKEIKQIKLLWVGRFSGFKGEIDLITACDILRKNHVNFHLEMIGDGEGRKQASQYIEHLGLKNNIVIIPYITNSKIPEHYQKAHVFILPSLYEGMPKVVLEAMSCGCPIIATDIPGCRELVNEGNNGLLIPIMRPDQLSKAIITLYKNPDLIVDMGKESRKIIENEYSWDIVSQRVEQCYNSVLRKRGKNIRLSQ